MIKYWGEPNKSQSVGTGGLLRVYKSFGEPVQGKVNLQTIPSLGLLPLYVRGSLSLFLRCYAWHVQ